MRKTDVNQAILARDIIDMVHEYKNDAKVMEYISNICFQVDQITEDAGVAVMEINWTEIFNYTDQKYYSLSKNDKSEVDESVVDKVYDYAVQIISEEKTN